MTSAAWITCPGVTRRCGSKLSTQSASIVNVCCFIAAISSGYPDKMIFKGTRALFRVAKGRPMPQPVSRECFVAWTFGGGLGNPFTLLPLKAC